ncbi:MAG: aspartate-semialdehyde dehydrogenase [Deltaproteobacteria bacterium]|nr:MAG: aspartate-semialdehyde dehydrogenase [Deltaproteobacteria bacterium]
MPCVVAVVGATGIVGREMLKTLAEQQFPTDRVVALASARSAGTTVKYGNDELTVQAAVGERFDGVDIALFSAGASASRELAPIAASRGAVVIDNSSAWRMDPEVPLVVPEVNPEAAADRPKGIIANPNCSTIQLVVALKPIHDMAKLKHVVVSTYQAASGKGRAAVQELLAQQRQLAAGKELSWSVFPGPLAQNLLMDWKQGTDGYSEEELKLVHETRKILGDAEIGVSPTCVRVPVVTGHSESLHVQCHEPISAAAVLRALSDAPGVVVQDEGYVPGKEPQPLACAGTDPVFVGRIRDDLAVPGAVNLWVVADNLRKGAALNAVQIAKLLVGA